MDNTNPSTGLMIPGERERNTLCKVDHRQSFLERCTLDGLDIGNRSQLFVEQVSIGCLRHHERSFQ